MPPTERPESSPSKEEGATQPSSADEVWREVGRQIEALGETLSRAFRAARHSEEAQQHVRTVRDSLEEAGRTIEETVRDADESDHAEAFRTEAERTARSLKRAGEKTWREMRPQLTSALTAVNAELERLIERLAHDGPENRNSETPTGCDLP